MILNIEDCTMRTEQQLGKWKPSKNFLVDRWKQRKLVSKWPAVEYCR